MALRKLSYGDYKDFRIGNLLDILIELNNIENGDSDNKTKLARTKEEVVKAMGF
jgi:hypothetical protein